MGMVRTGCGGRQLVEEGKLVALLQHEHKLDLHRGVGVDA